MRTLKDPVGDVLLATAWPKEAKTNAVQGLADTHVAGRRGCMVSQEDVSSKRQGDDDEHQKFLVVLDRWESDELAG